MPFPAKLNVPEFVRLEQNELTATLDVLRCSHTFHLYALLLTQMRFTDGQFLGGYDRLIELMTPPRPERGRRRPGPTLWQVRRAVDDLISVGLVHRGAANAAQGELRLHLGSRLKSPTKPLKAQPRPSN